MNLFDHAISAEISKRDAGIAQVMENSEDWKDLAWIEFREIYRWPAQKLQQFTSNDIKRWLIPSCGQPHHPNAWGAFVMRCIRAGMIEETGEFTRTGAHARKQTVYRWVV